MASLDSPGGSPKNWQDCNSPVPAAGDGSEDVPSIFQRNQPPSQAPLRSNAPRFIRKDSNNDRQKLGNFNRPRSSSISTSSEHTNEGPMSPDATDRVFPIRSFVSVDPNATTQPRSERSDYFAAAGRRSSMQASSTATTPGPGRVRTGSRDEDAASQNDSFGDQLHSRKGSSGTGNANYNISGPGQGYHIPADTASTRSESIASVSGAPSKAYSAMSGRGGKDLDDPGGLVTARFKHVVTEGGHAVITGRDGDTLQRCEDEPIHIPGAVQSFGLMIALQEDSEGRLLVRIVSENSRRILGYTPKQLFALESFTDILSEEQADNLLDHIDFIKDDGTDVEANGPEVFTMSVRNQQRRPQKLWCAMHINDKNPDFIICEFELEDDPQYPLVPLNDETPEPPEDTLSSEPTADELRESTETRSRPLRVLRSARKRRGEAAAMEVFNIMSQVQEQLAEAPNLDLFLKILVGVVKELTGFHRVMIYQFDHTWNGKVVTELVDTRATKDLYKGLHFPASDIPKQARDMYKTNKVRLLYDRDLETARLVCRTLEDLEKPLDMTHAYLRAMSPIHVKYLENMAVRSSMSISINAFNELWGLISCHAYGHKGTRVSFPIRKMCRLVGDSASRNIERLSYASRLQARKLINTSTSSRNPTGYIIASSEDLIRLFDADFGLLSIYDETKILGKLEGTQEALALLEYLRLRRLTSVMTSHDVRADFPDLRYPPGFQVIAGLLVVPLSVSGSDFIVFFRKGQLKEVKWAGNPYEKYIKEGTEGYLEPRKSFKSWTEKVVGRCREWSEEEVETAAVLCLVYGKFIEVWRQKEAALQNTQLTKLLLANSAHEVRTPLNAIINYLEIALEGSLDHETRENLSRSHSASKSLIYVINDLLDLTKTEASTELIHEETFELKTIFHEAVDMFAGDAKRKNITYEVIESPNLPEMVMGDQRRVRQAISNITANAIQATAQGGVRVEMTIIARYEERVDIEVIVEDTGVGMSSQQLDDLFAELEQAQTASVGLIEKAIAPDDTSGKDPKRGLGLGLAVVARIVKNMDGQLRVKSEEGKGSRFVIQFPFDLPASEARQALMPDAEASIASSITEVAMEHSSPDGELTLVDRSTPRRGSLDSDRPIVSRQDSTGSVRSNLSKRSVNSMQSAHSATSGHSARSDADRLIEAMQDQLSDSGDRHKRKHGSNAHHMQHGTSGSPSRHRPHDIGPKVPAFLRSSRPGSGGKQDLVDSRTPIKAVKMPDDEMSSVNGSVGESSPRQSTLVEVPMNASPERYADPTNADNLRVLVAEDDPINSRIVQKRLQKLGHEPYLTVNGEECSSLYGEKAGFFDVVLMDMQMPIVDGLTSSKMIRSFEKSTPSHLLSTRASLNGRVPIIAVSASLVEKERQTYIDGGFDGWILKPISFSRLSELLKGIVDEGVRAENLYKPGRWELGGWFRIAQPDVFAANTKPSDRVVASGPSRQLQAAVDSEKGSDPAGVSPHMQQARQEGQESGPIGETETVEQSGDEQKTLGSKGR